MATSKEGNKQSGSRGGQGSGTSNRGFASMDPERQREIASEGGKAAHEKGTAHEFTSEEARRAGSMSHGNRQSDQSRSGSESGKQSGNKQSDRASERGGRAGKDDDDSGGKKGGTAGGGSKSR
ncbi:MAG: KGG domain-containing protein [Pseudomonadota bacterium]